jgi:hypothetical protein
VSSKSQTLGNPKSNAPIVRRHAKLWTVLCRSCGSVTTSTYDLVSGFDTPDWWPSYLPNWGTRECSTTNIKTTDDVCMEWPLQVSGRAQGQVVWVNTVCEGGGIVPLQWQAPIYQHKGVYSGVIMQNWVLPNTSTSTATATTGSSGGTGHFGQDPHAAPTG